MIYVVCSYYLQFDVVTSTCFCPYSVPRLKRYLGCHHQNSPMIIGEMYGYKVNSNTSGYLFPTGGSG